MNLSKRTDITLMSKSAIIASNYSLVRLFRKKNACIIIGTILLLHISISCNPKVPHVRNTNTAFQNNDDPSCSTFGIEYYQSCTIVNGNGSQFRTCNNGVWSSFGECTLQSCNAGYTQSGNTCIKTDCIGSTSESCTITNGIGLRFRECNNGVWSSFGECTLQSCNADYTQSGNTCVKENSGITINSIPMFDDTQKYEYGASWMVDQFNNNKEDIYYCVSKYNKYNSEDVIGKRSIVNNIAQSEKIVLERNVNIDGNHVCDPTVIRGVFTDWQGNNFSYIMYYTTDKSSTPGLNNRINIAKSTDGVNWIALGSGIVFPDNDTYLVGVPAAISQDGGSKTALFFTYVDKDNKPHYMRALSNDGQNFEKPVEITYAGMSLNNITIREKWKDLLSWANPAFDIAQDNNYYYLIKVCYTEIDSQSYGLALFGRPTGLEILKIPKEDILNGTWTLVSKTKLVNDLTVMVEPGFKKDAWGTLGHSNDIVFAFAGSKDTTPRDNIHTYAWEWGMYKGTSNK